MIQGWILTLVIFGGVVAWAATRRRLGAMSPLPWFLFAFGLLFVIRPLLMIITGDYVPIWEYVGPVSSGFLAKTFFYAGCGLVAFIFGYERSLRSQGDQRLRLPHIAWPAWLVIVVAAGFTVVALTTAARFKGLSLSALTARSLDTNLVANIRQPTRVFTEHSAYVEQAYLFLVGVAMMLASRFGIRPWVLFMAGGSWLVGLVVGWGRGAVWLSYVALALVECGRDRRRRMLIAGAVLAPLAILLFIAVGQRRDLVALALADNASTEEILEASRSGGFWDSDVGMYESLVWTLNVCPDEIPYDYGRMYYEAWILGPIPRVLWPGKPMGPPIDVEALGERATGLGGSPSIVGVFYRNLGLLGVVTGMLGYGWFYGWLYRAYRRYQDRHYVTLVYCTLVALIPLSARTGLAGLPVQLFFWLLPGATVSLASVLLYWRPSLRRGPEPAAPTAG